MREIKFRGKDLYTGDWVYGDLETCPTEDFCRIHEYMEDGTYNHQSKVVKSTVGQFTGLYDKSGKEIYEGDIIESKNHYVHVIFFDSEKSAFMALEKGKEDIRDACPLLKWWVERYEKRVIGNIHDNFDLMK